MCICGTLACRQRQNHSNVNRKITITKQVSYYINQQLTIHVFVIVIEGTTWKSLPWGQILFLMQIKTNDVCILIRNLIANLKHLRFGGRGGKVAP